MPLVVWVGNPGYPESSIRINHSGCLRNGGGMEGGRGCAATDVRERRVRREEWARTAEEIARTTRVYCLSGSGMGFDDVVVGR